MSKQEFVKMCGGIPHEVEDRRKITEIVFILDASGSMDGLEGDTIGGVNAILKEQKKCEEGDIVYVSTVIFNTVSKVVHDRAKIEDVALMTSQDYIVGGWTALYDAVGSAIRHISNVHKYARKEDVPGKTTFVIMTDGMENASRHYTEKKVKAMLEEKQALGWEFVFLAANIDAAETAADIGISPDRAVDWNADKEGVDVLYTCVSQHLMNTRKRKKYMRDVFAGVDEDFKNRKK